jgi:competence protein ComEC
MKNVPHQRLFSLYPLFQLALAFSAGIFIANTVHIKPVIVISIAASSSLLALMMLLKRKVVVSGLALLLAFFIAGASAGIEQRKSTNGNLKSAIDGGDTVSLTGVLDEPPDFARDRVYLLLRVEKLHFRNNEQSVTGLVSLLASFNAATSEQEYRQLGLRYGTRLRVKTTLVRDDRYRNPGVSTLTDFLNARSLNSVGVIKSAAAIVRLGNEPVFRPLALLYQWRESLQRKIDGCFSHDTAGILAAALLGNRYNLSKSTSDRFREGGTFHVLVISGVHISFIGGLVFLFARRLTPRRLTQFVVSTLVVWGYSFAVGAEASVVRAACMFTLIALAQVVFRSPSALNSLGAAALALLTISPKELFAPSFQLTFLSVLAIVTLAWPIIQTCNAIGAWRPTRATPCPPRCSRLLKSFSETLYCSEAGWQKEIDRASHSYRLFKSPCASWLERKHLQRLVRYVANAVIVSLSVQIFLLPLFVLYFHRLSWSSLILNIFVSVLLAVLCFVALAAMMLSTLSLTLAAPLIQLTEFLSWLMVHSVDPFTRMGLASVRLPEYSGSSVAVYFIYYVPLVFLLVKLARWRPFEVNPPGSLKVSFALLAQMVLVATILFHPLSAGRPTGKLRVDFLDVGQGDAALVTMPDGVTLLVDGGGRPKFLSPSGNSGGRDVRTIGEMVVAEYLWWRGLEGVDYVLATHADADHIDGLNDVVRDFRVRSALVGRKPENDSEFSKFANTLQATATQVEVVQAGDVLDFGSVKIRVLWPAGFGSNSRSANNDSVVLHLEYGAISILLTGDIEQEAESQMLAGGNDVKADVVKVPHHGSRTSSTEGFVSAVKARFAIISVGQQSMFGHPHKEVVDRWQQSGAEVLTTGKSGTITVETDGKTLSVRKFVN